MEERDNGLLPGVAAEHSKYSEEPSRAIQIMEPNSFIFLKRPTARQLSRPILLRHLFVHNLADLFLLSHKPQKPVLLRKRQRLLQQHVSQPVLY